MLYIIDINVLAMMSIYNSLSLPLHSDWSIDPCCAVVIPPSHKLHDT